MEIKWDQSRVSTSAAGLLDMSTNMRQQQTLAGLRLFAGAADGITGMKEEYEGVVTLDVFQFGNGLDWNWRRNPAVVYRFKTIK